VERVVRVDRRAVELPRGRNHSGAHGSAVGAKGGSDRQGKKAERASGKMRGAQSRPFGIRVLEGHSSLQSW